MKKEEFLAALLTLALMAGVIFAFTCEYDITNPPDTGKAPALGAGRIREVKEAVQERLHADMFFPLTDNAVTNADTGKFMQITFTDLTDQDEEIEADGGSDDTHTVADNEGILDCIDIDSKRELCWWGEDDHTRLQITEDTGTAYQLYLAGTYANEVNLTHTDNNLYADQLSMKSGGYLTLPVDSTNTTEGNLHYNNTGDTVSYRTVSAWSTLATTAQIEKSCYGGPTPGSDTVDLTKDVGFAPGFIIAFNDGGNSTIQFWTAADAAASYYIGGLGNVNRVTATPSISVSGTTITFEAGATDKFANRGSTNMSYFAVMGNQGEKDPG